MHDNDQDPTPFAPPSGPPPYLSPTALHTLLRQGWLPLTPATLPTPLLTSTTSLFNTLPTYFDLPTLDKTTLYPAKRGTEWGHYTIPSEKQFLTLRCTVHPSTELETHAASVWSSAASLLHRILCDIVRADGVGADIWDDLLDGTLTLPRDEEAVSGTLLRMFQYEPEGGFASEHTDLGLLTLCMGDKPGLECLDMEASVSQGEMVWRGVDGPVVLVGQTVRGLSEGRINAGVHRVRATREGRMSAVFALRHGWKKEVDLRRFGGEGVVEPRRLYEEMKIGVLNINAKGEVRKKQLEALERQMREEERQQGRESALPSGGRPQVGLG